MCPDFWTCFWVQWVNIIGNFQNTGMKMQALAVEFQAVNVQESGALQKAL